MSKVVSLSPDLNSLQLNQQPVNWVLPKELPTSHNSASQFEQVMLLLLLRLSSLLLAAVCIVLVLTNWPSLQGMFWQQGNPFLLLFAVSGSSTIFFSILLSIRKKQNKPLHQFSLILSKNPSQNDLADYATDEVKEVLAKAALLARSLGSDSVEAIHLFAVLWTSNEVNEICLRIEKSANLFHKEIYTSLAASRKEGHRKEVNPSPSLQSQLMLAASIAFESDFYDLSPAALLLSFSDQRSTCAPARRFLQESLVHHGQLFAVSSWIQSAKKEAALYLAGSSDGTYRERGEMNRAWTAKPTPYLNRFSRDLTAEAGRGSLVLSSPYTRELDEILTALTGGSQRNVVIVSNEGADASSLLYALASKILEGDVPATLHDTRLLELDLTYLLTSSTNPEQAILSAVEEASAAGNVVLVLPKAAVLNGTAGGALDASQVLADALSQYAIQVITLATVSEYHRFIEQNTLLTQELRKVELHTLSQAETVLALEHAVPVIEATSKTIISYPALLAAAEQAERFLPESSPPSGARNLLETAVKRAGKDTLITAELISKATEEMVNVPVLQAEGAEADQLLNLEDSLHSRVIGQDNAVKTVSAFLRRARAGLQNKNRPVGSFLFVGPTGVGKTELAKALSDIYFGRENPMLRLDMSEYADARAIYRLIGAPQGTSNEHTEGGTLTQALRDHGFRLILLDELEKASPDVLNLFLQVLDDGRITENTGRTIAVTNAIIIATSNVAAREIGQIMQGTEDQTAKQEALLRALESVYKPEFLNRFDAIVPFQTLTAEELRQITTLMLEAVIAKLAAQDITLSFSADAIDHIVEIGYDPTYGARPLRRAIEQVVEGALANMLLKHQVGRGGTVIVTAQLLKENA